MSYVSVRTYSQFVLSLAPLLVLALACAHTTIRPASDPFSTASRLPGATDSANANYPHTLQRTNRAELALQVIVNGLQGGRIEQVKKWAIGRLQPSGQNSGGDVIFIQDLPECVRNLNPTKEEPSVTLLTDAEPATWPLLVMNWANPDNGYGLIFNESDSTPYIGGFHVYRIYPGVFAFYWEADYFPGVKAQFPTRGTNSRQDPDETSARP